MIQIGDCMKSVGVICEYNPFHNGHLYHIQNIKELYPDCAIVAVMSGNFTQRGDTSIIDKWKKTEMALFYGIDIVVEIPFIFATQSADTFAKAAIELLTALQVDYLVFGSESNNINHLKEMANIQLNHKKYNRLVLKYLEKGINYPSALSKALYEISGKNINKPNDILGISYIREIMKQESHIIPNCIKRNNDYNSHELNEGITSATSIRYALSHGDKVDSYVPEKVNDLLKQNLHFLENYFSFLKYKILSDKDNLNSYLTVDEGIENRILKYIISSKNLNELILKVKTKRYTYNKLNRMFTHILCNITKEEAKKFHSIEYIRLLGFSKKGQEYLNERKKQIEIPIITKYSDISSDMLELEFRITSIYASILDEKKKAEMIESEYKNSPIIR